MTQTTDSVPAALDAHSVSARTTQSKLVRSRFLAGWLGRTKRQLGDVFGLANFGVNLSELAPGGESALLHRHAVQDEFIYILDGRPTLGQPGMGKRFWNPACVQGFRRAGRHTQLVNCTEAPVRCLEIGDRGHG